MLCNLALCRRPQPDENGCLFVLRIAGKHTLGSAGQSINDERAFSSQAELMETLQRLNVPADVIAVAAACMEADARTNRFAPIGSDIQIPFPLLEELGFDVYD